MSESAETERSRSAPLVAGVLLSVMSLPALYVLSVGPAAWLVNHEYINRPATEAFYKPLAAAIERNETFFKVVVWYIELFGD